MKGCKYGYVEVFARHRDSMAVTAGLRRAAAGTWRSLPQCGLVWVMVTVGSPTVCPARVKFEHIPLFYRGWAAALGGPVLRLSLHWKGLLFIARASRFYQAALPGALLKLLWPRARYTRQAQWGHFHCQPAASASRSAQSRWPPGRRTSPKPVRSGGFFRSLHKYVTVNDFFFWMRNELGTIQTRIM